jgi:hypothetical protein
MFMKDRRSRRMLTGAIESVVTAAYKTIHIGTPYLSSAPNRTVAQHTARMPSSGGGC